MLTSGDVYCDVQVGLTFKVLDEILACDHTEVKTSVCGAIYYTVKVVIISESVSDTIQMKMTEHYMVLVTLLYKLVRQMNAIQMKAIQHSYEVKFVFVC